MKQFFKKFSMLVLTIIGIAGSFEMQAQPMEGPTFWHRHYWRHYYHPWRRYSWYRPHWYHRHYYW